MKFNISDNQSKQNHFADKQKPCIPVSGELRKKLIEVNELFSI